MPTIVSTYQDADGPADFVLVTARAAVPGLTFVGATAPILSCLSPDGLTEIEIPGVILYQDATQISLQFNFDGLLTAVGDWRAYVLLQASVSGSPLGPVREDGYLILRVRSEYT